MRINNRFFHWLWLLLIGGLLCWSVSMASAAGREIKPIKEWRGRVLSVISVRGPVRGYVAGQEELNHLWAGWQIAGKAPKVDFKTRLVLVRTCNCSHISLAPLLNEQGDLQMRVTVTKDIREDTAYVMVLIPRQGIRTVEGKPLEGN